MTCDRPPPIDQVRKSASIRSLGVRYLRLWTLVSPEYYRAPVLLINKPLLVALNLELRVLLGQLVALQVDLDKLLSVADEILEED